MLSSTINESDIIIQQSSVISIHDKSTAKALTSYVAKKRMDPQQLISIEIDKFQNVYYIGFLRSIFYGLNPPHHMLKPFYLLGKDKYFAADLFRISDNIVTWKDDIEQSLGHRSREKFPISPVSDVSASKFTLWHEVIDATAMLPKHYNVYLLINDYEKIGPMRLRMDRKEYYYSFFAVIIMNVKKKAMFPNYTVRILPSKPKTLAELCRFKVRECCDENRLNKLPIPSSFHSFLK